MFVDWFKNVSVNFVCVYEIYATTKKAEEERKRLQNVCIFVGLTDGSQM